MAACVWGEGGMLSGCDVSFWGDENVLELVVLVTQ